MSQIGRRVQRTQPTSLLALIALGILLHTPFVARAEDFCAVTAEVFAADGRPNNMTWIQLDDPSGKPVRKELVRGPIVRICDFGFGPHTLRIGINECLSVSISNLRVVFGSPLHLRVYTNVCGYRSLRSGCLAYFRVVDDSGAGLPDVDLSLPPSDRPQRTDSFGRWQGLFSGNRHFVFSKPGFEAVNMQVECRRDEEIEQQVVMKRAPPRQGPSGLPEHQPARPR